MTRIAPVAQPTTRGEASRMPAASAARFWCSRRPMVAAHAKRRRPTMVERYGLDAEEQASVVKEPEIGADGTQWLDVGLKAGDFALKAAKPVLLANGQALVVYKAGNDYFCSDANSTAFKFPMSDATVTVTEQGRPQAEVPLDGTVYDLATGEVVTWCPKNNPIRAMLGSMKAQVEPIPLKMYRTKLQGGRVM